MPRALELIGGFVTAPSTTLTAVTMMAGNTLQVRNSAPDKPVALIGAWARNQGAGVLRIRSPSLHDNVQGMRFGAVVNKPRQLVAIPAKQSLKPQDLLTVELSGSATAGDIEQAFLLTYYDDLPGIEGRFLTAEEFYGLNCVLTTIENTLALGTGGGWSGEEALNAEYSLLRANTDYALLGYQVSVNCGAVRWRGTDFGNLGVGGPGDAENAQLTNRWFVDLATATGLALIPIINSANLSSVLIDGATDENGTDVIVWSILAQLPAA